MNNENIDKYCFFWPILAHLRPCKNNHPNRVSKYKQYFNEISNNGLDFANGFKCSNVHKVDELNNLSNKIFDLNFYQDKNKWRHKLIPNEVSKK